MLPGIAFVLSKHYSDKLSIDVKRGTRRRFEGGKTPTPKHGYINEGGIFSPDGKNFELIKEAWQMRLESQSLETIAQYMNSKSYGRKVKRTGRLIRMSKKILTDLFKDSFYYGVLVQATQTVDLRLLYDFETAVDEDEYNQVQFLTRGKKAPYNLRRNYIEYPFRGVVRCSYCKHNMVIGPSSGHTKRYLYVRCDYEGCARNSKENKAKSRTDPSKIKISVRVKPIIDFLKDFFATKFNLTEEDYKRYYERLDSLSGEKRVEIQTEIRSLNGALSQVNKEMKAKSLALTELRLSGPALKMNEQRINELDAQRIKLEEDIAKEKEKLTDPEHDRLSREQFLNLVEKAETIIKTADDKKKDTVVKIIFLNLDIDDEKVASYRLKPPFDTMLKTRVDTPSRGGQN